MKMIYIALGALVLFGLPACNNEQGASDTPVITTQADYETPPAAARKPQTFDEFGNQRVDDYFWIKDKSNPEVIQYLEAENAYTATVMKKTEAFQERLYEELKGRIKEDDSTVPVPDNGYYYYSRTEKGKQYRIHCRKKGSPDAQEEVILDENKLAEGKEAFIMRGYVVSPDNRLAAYISNTTGSYADFTLRIRDLSTGKELPDVVPSVAGTPVWATDSKTLFYVKPNVALRPYQAYRHHLGENGKDPLLFEEKDDQFSLYFAKSKTGDYIFLDSESYTSTEYRYLPAGQPESPLKVFSPREQDKQYYVDHHKSRFFIYYKDLQNTNFKILEAPLKGFEDKRTWKDFIAHDPKAKIEGFDVFDRYLTVQFRHGSTGLQEIRVMDLRDKSVKSVKFPEPVYVVYPARTPEYNSTRIRYNYMSLNRPNTTYDYDMVTGKSEKIKEQEVPSGFDPDDYVVERLWAPASDGVKVPMAVVYKKGLQRNGKNPALLYSYGSYGATTDAYFDADVFSLVDRGFVYAIAQIRGGSDLGEQWYEDGKLLKKKNTFTDFIACAEHLIREKYTSAQHLAIQGGSAGGLLMGAVVNMRPDLFQAVVAQVPFVDVINTMKDTLLPLTTQEFEQWGSPYEKQYYDYMLSYSPYDNVKAQAYPHILVTGGLNDSQVGFHEPAKWVARLRATKTDDHILLLRTNMESGHGGATGRYGRLKDTAFEWAFIMDRLGVKDEKVEKLKG